jgi:hypothetical protein
MPEKTRRASVADVQEENMRRRGKKSGAEVDILPPTHRHHAIRTRSVLANQ